MNKTKIKHLFFFCFKASGVEWKILGMVLWLDDGCLVLTYENAFTLTLALAHTRMHTNPAETCCECIFRIKIWHSLSFNIWYITLHTPKFYCTKSLYSAEWLNDWLSLSWSLFLVWCSFILLLYLFAMLITITSFFYYRYFDCIRKMHPMASKRIQAMNFGSLGTLMLS